MLTFIFPLAAGQTTSKQQKTDAYITVDPNPVGVGQAVSANFWISPYPPTALTDVHGFMVKITAPDGTVENKGPFDAFKSSSSYFLYTPRLVGNYKFDFSYPGELYFNGSLAYLPSGASTNLTVQKDPIPLWPETAPTSDYWTRPLSAANRPWYTISGPWLGIDNGNEWSQDVSSPHVMWKTPIDIGGVAGGPFGISNFYEGSAYEAKGGSPIIIGGYLFLTGFDIGQRTGGGTEAFDLRTGQQVWYLSNVTINFGWEMKIDSGNLHAIIPYLVTTGTTFRFYDPLSGRELFEFANATAPTSNVFTYSPNDPLWPTTNDGTWPGTWLAYTAADNARGSYVLMWNATKAFEGNNWITYQSNNRVTNLATWAPPATPGIGDWSKGLMWNVSSPAQWGYDRSQIPANGNLTNWPKSYLSAWTMDRDAGVMIATINPNGIDNSAFAGYSMKTGALLWTKNITDVAFLSKYYGAGGGVYVIYSLIGSMYIGLNSQTGAELWRTPPLTGGGWTTYNNGPIIYKGLLFTMGYSGYVICNNMTDGKELWATQVAAFNGESPIDGGNPVRAPPAFSQGLMYIGNQVKTDENPMIRNQGTSALNYTSGKVMWTLYFGPTGEGRRLGVSDGYLVTYAGFTSERVVLGKGPSATTVSAPQTAVPRGTTVLFTGTVTDQSPAQKDTPAISDASMSNWMAYLYMQWPKPTNATGVPVHLTAIDPNNNYQDIGTTTSNIGGSYGLSWTPPVPGLYTVTATFAGSNSYGSSTATTYLYVSEAASAAPIVNPTQTPTTTTPAQTVSPSPSSAVQPPTSGMPVTTYVVIGAAVVIVVAAAAALIFRKRK